MKLTAFSDYSIRVLLYVAINNDRLVSIKEVSKEQDISQNHLMKIVYVLGKGGYLKTLRGKNGGFQLGMVPEEINLGDLIRYTEDDLSIVECHGPTCGKCQLKPGCQFSVIVLEAKDAFLHVLDKYTLASLTENIYIFDILKSTDRPFYAN